MTTTATRAHRKRQRLVESHLPLVHSLARRYAGQGESLDDLVQVGAMGLVKAGSRFDESRGVAFAAFAGPLIEGEIRRHLRDRSAPLRIPRDLQRASRQLRRKHGQLTAASGRSPSTSELADALGIDEEHVQRALAAELARDAVPLVGDGDEVLEGLDSIAQEGSDERLSLARSIRVLDERERTIVFLRFHLDMTERQIGRELEISQAQVSRLLNAALARLRAELAGANAGASVPDTTIANERDTSENSVISADLSRAADTAQQDVATAKPADGGPAAGESAGAPADQQSAQLADYLELPYTVAVQLEREGKHPRWNATVEELPGCAAQGRSPDEAVKLLRGAMESWLSAAIAQRREIPVPTTGAAKPKATSSHSGRFLVRMPGALHAQLAQAAEREQLSLNRFVTNVLAASVSATTPTQPEMRTPPQEQLEPAAHTPRPGPSRAFRVALATNITVVVLAAVAAIVLLVLALHGGT